MADTPDPRLTPAAKTLANQMGCPRSWRTFLGEARAVLETADIHDPLRKTPQ